MKLLINMVILMLFITSCEKVIDVKLDSVAKKYVIEGNISDEPGVCQVKITQTKDFDEDNTVRWAFTVEPNRRTGLEIDGCPFVFRHVQ